MYKPRLRKVAIAKYTFEKEDGTTVEVKDIAYWSAWQDGYACWGTSPKEAYDNLLEKYNYYHMIYEKPLH